MNSATEHRTCPNCGVAIPAKAPQGICPKCLMAAAAVTTDAGQTGGKRPEPPSLERLAAAFPQLEVLEFIGQGGMGAVYKARQKQLDRIVALKVLPPGIGGDPSFAERFTREAKALAKLLHPNIVALFEFGQADGIYYLLMEYVDGVSLGQLLRASRVSAREALAIVPQICDALQYAHDQGIVHRDIKPENILLDRHGRVKVADFGLAKLVEGRDASPRHPDDGERTAGPAIPTALTDAGKIMGTPNYMAPEQAEHPGEVDHRADIYALGVVFYQMLTGELPGKRMEPPSKKVQIDVRLDEVVMRALEKDPGRRYSQASVLKTQVETIATEMEGPNDSPASARGRDYRTRQTLFGLPLVHVVWGIDPATGRPRVAKGILAVGPAAFGVIAVGFSAWGLFPCGLVAGGIGPVGLFAVGFWTVGLVAAGVQAVGLCALASWHAVGLVAASPTPIGLERIVVGKGMVGLLFLVSIIAAWFMHRLIRAMGSAPASTDFGGRRREEAQTERGSGRVESDQRSESRFSRTAIVGVCFGILGMFGLVLYAVIGDSNLLDEEPSNVLAALTALCALISTILGWVAVSQIRRSARKLHGMWLAVSDGLLFPLLALNGLIAFQASNIVQTFSAIDAVFAQLGTQPASDERFKWLAGIATACICVIANTLITWGVWRAVNNRSKGVPPADYENATFGKWARGPLLVATLGPSLLMTVVPWQEGWAEGLAAAIGSVALALALVWGLIHWRERLGKFVVIATNVLFVALIVAAAVLSFVIVPAKRARLQATFGPVTEYTLPMDEDGWTPLFDLDHNQPVTDPKPGDTAGNRAQHLAQLKKPGVAIHHDGQTKVFTMSGMTMHYTDGDGDQWERITDMDTLDAFLSSANVTVPGGYQTGDFPGKLPLTLFFKTGVTKLGLLQITGFTENPRGVKIRYKLVLPQSANLSARLAHVNHRNTNTAGFGPVIERTINLSEPERDMFLSFETGKLMKEPGGRLNTPEPEKLRVADEALTWARSSGADVLVRFCVGKTGPDSSIEVPQLELRSLDMAMFPTNTESWDGLSSQTIATAVRSAPEHGWWQGLAWGARDFTFLFRTRQGNAGILLVTEYTDKPRSVTLYYKLVQATPAATPPARSQAEVSPAATSARLASALQFRWVARADENTAPAETLEYPSHRSGIRQVRVLKEVVLDGSAVAQVGWHPGLNPSVNGARILVLRWNSAGRQRFAELTAANTHRQLAVVLNGRVLSAPNIAGAIDSGTCELGGDWTEAEMTRVVADLSSARYGAEELQFGPTREVVLPQRSRTGKDLVFLNLVTQRWMTNNTSEHGSREFHEWVRQNGADLSGGTDLRAGQDWLAQVNPTAAAAEPATLPMAFCYNTVVLPAETNAWNSATPIAVKFRWELSTQEPEKETLLVKMAGSPETSYIRTRDGDYGLLQITGFTDNPRGVKIRYKMVLPQRDEGK